MNLKEIKELIALMNENNLTEIEVEKEGMRIKLHRGNDEPVIAPQPVIMEREQAPHPKDKDAKSEAEEKIIGIEIKSPMVGTFYRAPAPDAAPFVNKGDTIQPGQVICIIEAMKLMNEIKAEVRGRIKEVPVENAEPVEFGQTLFLIEPI